jgi:hypothetical protein
MPSDTGAADREAGRGATDAAAAGGEGRDESTAGRDESTAGRDDRNLAELLQELRVAGLGVQVLFGFLLSLPFTNRFTTLSHAQRQLYIGCLLLAALATALLLGPVAYHRLVFRRQRRMSRPGGPTRWPSAWSPPLPFRRGAARDRHA